MKTRVPFLIALLGAAVASLQSIHANIVPVMNTSDSGPGSLRNALAAAKDGDMIDATGVSGTILLSTGELQITHNVTINGPGKENLSVNGNATFRVFENFASNVTISALTITSGSATDGNGGGGVLNRGGLTLSESIVSNSRAPVSNGQGGGISNRPGAELTVTGSTVNGNFACQGGGIYTSNAQLTVMNSTINGNTLSIAETAESFIPDPTCGGAGGGIFGDDGAIITVVGSTINGNYVGCFGGGIFILNAQLDVMNSTISRNSAFGLGGICESGVGGGIYAVGTATVTNSTISGNSATYIGGGIYNRGTTTVGDTILSAGDSGGTIYNDGGRVTSLGYNLASDNGGGVLIGSGDRINTDPMLGPLRDNGGPTFTHALLRGSAAVDAGDLAFTPPPFYDQRGPGFARVIHGRIDIGAFERQQPTPTVTPTASPTPTPTTTPRLSPTPRPAVTPRPRP